MRETIKKLIVLFNKKEKKQFIMLFALMIIAAIFETLGIGMIVPFVGIITNPEIIYEQTILLYLYETLNFQSPASFIIFSVIVLLSIFVIKNLYLLLFYYIQFRIIFKQQVKLSKKLFAAYLTKPYTFHLERNSADLLRNVNGEVPKIFQGIILSSFHLLTEILVVICILTLLLIAAPIATLTASFLLILSVVLFFKVFRNKINSLGIEQQKVGGAMIKWVNQGLGASKEVKVSGRENYFINSYTNKSKIQAKNNSYMKMLEQIPRLFIETILVSIIFITMIVIIFQGTTTAQIVSTMALFAMAAFRLMPSINRIITMITTIKYNQPALKVVYNDLIINTGIEHEEESEISSNEIVNNKNGNRYFNKSIQLVNVSFRYPNQNEYSVNDVSLSVPIGHSVAFIGESGAGKTTIVDIILGLYEPEKGKVFVDNKPLNSYGELWKRKIGYIPQNIFLTDDTIRGNVAFGINMESIDDEQVWDALEQAHLKEFVLSLPDQLDTHVGERGVRLSGGQRQRIGIARALYHNPEILFMDEATSALDNETEKEIMKAIDGLKGEKTLIIIAHRLSTIENCNTVFKMSKGRLVSIENNSEKAIL
ncbi:ABC transporter ATP-binding protein [Alkalihalobacterium alkalinitrilicum]|uniref:ABC transporter ATP-binding protein n=1 Tax=Alkalihalobacterium alkalinitrilicum TaxID=427920 RepID=UPI0009948E4A|nr:ABC transporter ATP-binding protein [Alkalihalobacterium alkalinitrilicum]